MENWYWSKILVENFCANLLVGNVWWKMPGENLLVNNFWWKIFWKEFFWLIDWSFGVFDFDFEEGKIVILS